MESLQIDRAIERNKLKNNLWCNSKGIKKGELYVIVAKSNCGKSIIDLDNPNEL
jgi:energy-coupling factor transporter ATP-binding protein EcfA2